MNWRSMLRAKWQAASKREQALLLWALGVVAMALLWWLALAPALAVHKTADASARALETQLQHMQRLQAQARALQALPTLDAPETRRALEASLAMLAGAAQLSVQMDRVVFTLKGAPASRLALWLGGVRQNAHLVPTEAHLKRNGADAWDGSVVFVLPAQ